jgi:hypothetical protein
MCVRYPTHVDEAAEVYRRLAGALLQGEHLGSVAHWSMAVLTALAFTGHDRLALTLSPLGRG